MAQEIRTRLAPPANWQDFEVICADLFEHIWSDPLTKLHGRSGQDQLGVDVYGKLSCNGEWQGVQCKGKDGRYGAVLTEKEVITEVNKAKNFKPKLSSFTIVTTTQNDVNLEQLARRITEQHAKIGLFRVEILGWDEIVRRLRSFEKLMDKYYPNQSQNMEEIRKNISSLAENVSFQNRIHQDLCLDAYCPACGVLIPKEAERCFSCSAQIISGPTEEELKDGMLFGGFGGFVSAAMIFKAFEFFSIEGTVLLIGLGIAIGAGFVQNSKKDARRYLKIKL